MNIQNVVKSRTQAFLSTTERNTTKETNNKTTKQQKLLTSKAIQNQKHKSNNIVQNQQNEREREREREGEKERERCLAFSKF